ncbi:MAG: hypothetical protein L0099_14815 [Acidobacteria bacterium]|nr:hypothetical protein [Acidobacteriota bacterium]
MENPKPNPASSDLEEFGRKVGRELREIVTYLNNEVVPKAREQSSQGLRIAAQKLTQLAEYMEKNKPSSS